jgi:hypothetical protein
MKNIIALALAALMMAALVGCAAEGGETKPADGAADAAKTESK